jgi:carboxyl-terminal processing protease
MFEKNDIDGGNANNGNANGGFDRFGSGNNNANGGFGSNGSANGGRFDGNNRGLAIAISVISLALAFILGFIACNFYYNKINTELNSKYKTIDMLIDEISKNYYEDVDKDALIAAAIKGMFTELDPYSTAYTSEEYLDIVNGSQIGNGKNFGISIRTLTRRPVSISRVVGGSPAEIAGYKVGDEIIKIHYDENGVQKTVDAAYRSQAEVFDILSAHSTFSLTVQRVKADRQAAVDADFANEIDNASNYEPPITLPAITAAEYEINYVYYYFGADKNTLGYTPDVAPNCGYIKLTGFEGRADAQFDAAMALFKQSGREKLILDLRDNLGGYTNILGSIGSYLVYDAAQPALSKIPIFVAKYKNGTSESYTTASSKYVEYFGAYNPADKKIVVLVNGMSASASEALSSAIEDYGTGTLVGTTTYKKGKMQSYFNFPTLNYCLKVTTALYYSPVRTDFTLNDVGLLTDTTGPNYVADNFYRYEYNRKLQLDAQFLRAQAVLNV